jgi:hypothetical protein
MTKGFLNKNVHPGKQIGDRILQGYCQSGRQKPQESAHRLQGREPDGSGKQDKKNIIGVHQAFGPGIPRFDILHVEQDKVQDQPAGNVQDQGQGNRGDDLVL